MFQRLGKGIQTYTITLPLHVTPTIYALVRNYLTCQNISERKARESSNFGSQPFVNNKKISMGLYHANMVEYQNKFLKLKGKKSNSDCKQFI